MSKPKIGLNGFGRVGRIFTRIAFERGDFEITAVNTRSTQSDMMAYLFKYDSVYKTFKGDVSHDDNSITINRQKIVTMNEPDPSNIDWKKYDVDFVVDATGAFKTWEDLSKHEVGRVLLTAPAKDDKIPEVVLGCNSDDEECMNSEIVSNASCTTNCSAPLFKILEEEFGIESGFLTTTHAYTASQSLLDDSNKKKTRSRAATLNIIPTTTGAAQSVTKIIPSLKDRIDGIAVRVPVPVGSFVDISAVLKPQSGKKVTVEEINSIMKRYSENEMKGILGYAEDEIVSSDIVGLEYSSIFDPNYTQVINGNFVKIFGWYDNEWGYCARLVDMVNKLV